MAIFEVFVVEYSSLRSTIDDQARSLARIINHLDGIDEINLVGHSMGNIVIRRYLAGDKTPLDSWQADRRIARIVMIAPPNHGSSTAERLSDNSVFKAVFGESGRQLGVNWDDLEQRSGHTRCRVWHHCRGLGQSDRTEPLPARR